MLHLDKLYIYFETMFFDKIRYNYKFSPESFATEKLMVNSRARSFNSLSDYNNMLSITMLMVKNEQ